MQSTFLNVYRSNFDGNRENYRIFGYYPIHLDKTVWAPKKKNNTQQ